MILAFCLVPRCLCRDFGFQLIEAIFPPTRRCQQNDLKPGGASCHGGFPLHKSESIFETEAPGPTHIYEGPADTTRKRNLAGRTILAVEDDYSLSDIASALRGAGAKVLGQFPVEDDTFQLLEEAPSAAITDPRFEVARAFSVWARGSSS